MAAVSDPTPFPRDGRWTKSDGAEPGVVAPTVLGAVCRFVGDALAWFAGARPATLRYCPSERPRLAALGFAVLVAGAFGGFGAMLATGYFLHQAPARFWPIGLAWGLALSNLDRLLIMLGGTGRRLLITIPMRLALAIPVGILVTEVLLLQIFQPEENALIGNRQQTQLTQTITALENSYQPKIAAAQNKAAQAQKMISSQSQALEQNRFLAGCEANDPSCSTTHETTCGQYCQHYQRLARDEQTQLESVRPALERQVATAQQEASRLDGLRLSDEAAARTRVSLDNGLAAHKQALDQLQQHDGGTRELVWLLRLSVVLLDLTPVLLKAFFVLLGATLYDEMAAAMQAVEGTQAHWFRKLVWFTKRQTDRDFEARDEVDEAQVDAETEQQVNEAYGTSSSSYAGSRPRSPRPESIDAIGLADFAGSARRHESQAVPVHPALRRAAWMGLFSLVGLVAIVTTAPFVWHAGLRGTWLSVSALLVGVALAGRSRGFRLASAALQRAIFAAAIAGLVLPFVLLALNV